MLAQLQDEVLTVTEDIRAQLAAIAAGQAAMNERMAAVERSLATEHVAGSDRGNDQRRIGERVATLEADSRHVIQALNALTSRVNAATFGSVGSGAAVIWALMQSGLLGGTG